MGAGQSKGDVGADVEVKTSYYDLLGIDRQATEEQIKKAYRRKALELHPDRNYGNEEQATTTFAEVQAAHEVLSDPQERAWYDSHESAILRGSDGTTQDEAPTYQNVRITTADDLARMVRKFNSNIEFSDSPSGFFGFVRETFEQLAKEEEVAASWEDADIVDYPAFGHKDDSYDDVVKRFYSAWSSFSTVKNFAWKDKYKLSEAPDRWYRRRMEQENKAYRKEGIKEFNEAVRSLVLFIRKRDPRYVPSTQSEAERQQVLRDAAAAQAARARAANQTKLSEAVPEWTKARDPEELEESEEEEVVEQILECVACNKSFKSEKQWEAHEKSKKHQKALQALQRKMRKENAHLDLSESQASSGFATPDTQDEQEDEAESVEAVVQPSDHETEPNGHAESDLESHNGASDTAEETTADHSQVVGEAQASEQLTAPTEEADGSVSEDSDYASAEAISARLNSVSIETPSTAVSDAGVDDELADQTAKPKLGKAAQKRAKKASAATVSELDSSTHNCATCNAVFPSKTRLFQHIKDHGHAALKPATTSASKGKKAKGKR